MVEDEAGLVTALRVGLQREGYAVDAARTLGDAAGSSPSRTTTSSCST